MEFYSPLSVEDFVLRLSRKLDRESWWEKLLLVDFLTANFVKRDSVAGRINGSRVKLWVRGKRYNSFRVIFHGTLHPLATGTLISGRFGMSRLAIAAIAMVMLGSLLVALLKFPARSGDHLTAFVLFSGVIITLGRCMARGEKQQLQQFLVAALEARLSAPDVTVPHPPAPQTPAPPSPDSSRNF